MQPAPMPLFPEPPRPARRGIAGFMVGDRVAFGPALKGLERHGRIIALLPAHGEIVVRSDDHSIVTLTPDRCRKRA